MKKSVKTIGGLEHHFTPKENLLQIDAQMILTMGQ